MWKAEEKVLKRRAAVERWKANNRGYYLQQKRALSARPAYKAHRREIYHAKRQELIDEGLAPRKLGRPQLYFGEEAIEIKRERAREAAARYRARKLLSQLTENAKVEETSED